MANALPLALPDTRSALSQHPLHICSLGALEKWEDIMHTRRALIAGLLAGLAAATIDTAEAAPPARRGRRRTRRRVRRRVRRRHRRRVRRRVVAGRTLLVVPVAAAVGWELMVDNSVYVVTRVYVVDGQEMVDLQASNGIVKSEPVVREDTADNTVEMEGSTLPEDDTTTPGIETEV